MPIIQRSAVRAVSRASRMASAARVTVPSVRSGAVPSIAKAVKVPGTYLCCRLNV